MIVQLHRDGEFQVFLTPRMGYAVYRAFIPPFGGVRAMQWAVLLALKKLDDRTRRRYPWRDLGWGWEATFSPNDIVFPSQSGT